MNLCCTRYAKHATAFGHKNRAATIITTAKGSRQRRQGGGSTQETQADELVKGQEGGDGGRAVLACGTRLRLQQQQQQSRQRQQCRLAALTKLSQSGEAKYYLFASGAYHLYSTPPAPPAPPSPLQSHWSAEATLHSVFTIRLQQFWPFGCPFRLRVASG